MAFKKPTACEACSLHSHGFVPPTYAQGKVLLVAQSPGTEEIKYGKVLIGPAGKLLNKMLTLVGINRDSLSLTNALLCFEGKNLTDADKAQALTHCKVNLDYVVSKTKPKFIISCGAYALKNILGKEKISDKRGKIYFSKEYNCPVLVTLHPAAVLRECTKEYPNKPYADMTMKERDFFNDFRQAAEFIRKELWEESQGFWATNDEKERVKDGKQLVPELDTSGYHLGTDADRDPIQQAKFMAVDIELDKGISEDAKLLSVAISVGPGQSAVWFAEDGFPDWVLAELASDKPKLVAARPFDENWLADCGIKLGGKIYDVLPLAHLLDENYYRYNLESVAAMYADMHKIKTLANNMRENLGEADRATVISYNGVDSDATLRSFVTAYRSLKTQPRLHNYYENFIMPVQNMLAKVIRNGCKIDKTILEANLSEAHQEIDRLEQEMLSYIPAKVIQAHVGKLKFSRDAFMRDILFSKDGLKLKPNDQFLTAKQKLPQITEDHLKLFSSRSPFIPAYLKWAKIDKVVTGYMNPLLNGTFIHSDGCIYPSTLLHATVTGRTVIKDPPMQTYPQHGDYARLIKECIIAEDGWVLGARDLDQSELRIAGWLSGDKNILAATRAGIDLHTNTAAKVILSCGLDQVTKEARRQAKPVNFGFIYGMSADSLVDYAKNNYDVILTSDEAYRLRLRYFSYPDGYYSLPTYYKAIEAEILETGFVDGVLGRRRRFPSCKGDPQQLGSVSDKGIWGENLRQGINFKVQNFSTDLAIIGMMLFQKLIDREKLGHVIKPMWFIHDSVIFKAREDYYSKGTAFLKLAMEELSVQYVKKYFGVDVGYPVGSSNTVGISWEGLK